MPAMYWCLLVTPTLTSGFEFFMAIWKGGGTPEALLSHFIGVVIGVQLCWYLVSLKLGFALCYRFASRSRLDWLKTLLIFLVTLGRSQHVKSYHAANHGILQRHCHLGMTFLPCRNI